jgi:ribosomal protein S18 acetylase RimI-like enzyme
MTIRIDRNETRNAPERRAVSKALEAYNDPFSGDAGPSGHLNLLLRETGSDEVVGGLCAVTYWRWMFIEMLIVPQALRGQGLGSGLLRQAEAVARERNCLGIWLDTFSFQAPCFYEKLGFTRFGQIDSYPPNHSRMYYMKSLAAVG